MDGFCDEFLKSPHRSTFAQPLLTKFVDPKLSKNLEVPETWSDIGDSGGSPL